MSLVILNYNLFSHEKIDRCGYWKSRVVVPKANICIMRKCLHCSGALSLVTYNIFPADIRQSVRVSVF